MKTIKINKLIQCMVGLVSAIGSAQTINTGELSINRGSIFSTLGALDNKATGDLVNDGELYVYNHYNNDGLVTFSTGVKTGMTRMIGLTGYQDISGSMPIECYNVEFKNSNVQPAFHLSNRLSIAGNASFNQGIVDDDAYPGLIIFENEGSHSDVNDESHVDGNVRKNGENDFQFPIGDAGKFRYAALSAPDNAADAFTSKYFLQNSDLLYPHKSKTGVINVIDNTEYWNVEKTAGNSDVLLTLSWDENTTPAEIYAAPYEEIHIVRWDATQNIWVDQGGAADADTKEVSTIVAPEDGYGVFALARVKTEIILPCNGKQVVVYNAVSPNNDGINDSFIIDGIDKCVNNTVEVYNRWGAKVFETKGYNTSGNVFKGISEGRLTVNKGEKLPTGTYFYIINFLNDANGSRVKKAGYLYLNN